MSAIDALTATAAYGLTALEGPLWLLFLITIGPVLWLAVQSIRAAGQGRALAAVLAVAIALRLLVPWEPIYWHYPLMNLDLARELYTRENTYLPLLIRILVFDLNGGFDAALTFNLLAGTASIVLLWYTALAGGQSRRACTLFAALLAVTPMYVRHSGSDSAYVPLLFLYSASAAAYGSLTTGGAWRMAAPLLVSSLLLGMPIRGETAWVFFCLPLFQLRTETSLWDAIRPRPATLLLGAAALVGGVALLSIQSHSFGERLHVQLAAIVLGLITQITCTPDPGIPTFFPALIAVPIWLTAIDLFRRRRWKELLSLYLPIWFSRIPHLFGAAFMVGGLATTGYHILSALFILLASARGLDYLYLRYQRGEFLVRVRRRRVIVAVGTAAMVLLCVQAYSYRYVEGQEMRFLRRELPREPTTVLVIWDPDPSPGDDCCLALPYPPLWAQLPNTRWIVLTLADLDRPGYVRDLRFDLYYPGTTIQLADSTNWYTVSHESSDDERLSHQRDGLRRWRELDALVRRTHPLELWRSQTVRAKTPSFAHFDNDQVTFAIYRPVASALPTDRPSAPQ